MGIKIKTKSDKLITRRNFNILENKCNHLENELKNLCAIQNTNLHKNNFNSRILVVLHLFYMESWERIKHYLDNLQEYNYDLIITCTNGFYDDKTLNEISKYKNNTQFYFYDNIGFDIGPFVDVLNKINLDEYDVVYKIHSKGIHRRYIHIYHQIFKNDDWFKNLFDGILGLFSVHETIDKILNNNSVAFVAAQNLIIQDPKHKQKFVADIAKQINISIEDNYYFVAGSCWATSSENLKALKALNLTIKDFSTSERNTFSFAHAMERISNIIMCANNKKPYGINTYYNKYLDELEEKEKYNSLRLLDDDSFKIDYDFFYKCLECCLIYDYRIDFVKLKDIKREWLGKYYSLDELSPYKYLEGGGIDRYQNYCKVNKELHGFDMSKERFDNLIHSIEDKSFDSMYLPILNQDNVIIDGQHRLCYYLKNYGEEYPVKVLKLKI